MKTGNCILIVEDSRTQALMLKHQLESFSCLVEIACSAEAALEVIKERRPSLIISDFVMADMNGVNLCQKIRQDPDFSSIPFILMTARDDIFEGQETIGKGGPDALITKPVECGQLDQLLKKFMNSES